jgi:formylglycine-generating enzyme required for sulfatase activity/tRNA A-37 threonylcarbamoyl transferase component Bud32
VKSALEIRCQLSYRLKSNHHSSFQPEGNMPLTTGQVLNNRYRIVKLLGQGGMGAVYKAWDLNMERPRALKENLDASLEAQRQFKREAQILGDLSHPNLPKVIDHFSLSGQGQYLVMDFVEGEDLSEMLVRQGGALPVAQALGWIEQACAALEYLHNQNPPVIHRDVKPANIKITLQGGLAGQGKAMLVDFGIAKVFDPNLSTTVGAKAVTPGYSPMEQYGSGQHTGPATDIYALGATLYTLLSGQAPPDAPDRNLGASLLALRGLNPAVTPGVEAAVLKAMAMQPQDRFTSASEFAAALRPAPPAPQPATIMAPQAFGAPYTGVPAAPARRRAKTPARRIPPLPYWLQGLLALVLGVIFLVIANDIGLWPFSRAPTQTATAVALPITVRDTVTAAAQTAEVVLGTQPAGRATRPPAAFTLTAVAPSSSEPPANAQLGDTWTCPTDGMTLVYIPAGEFLMGSLDSDPDATDAEKPQHTVYLDAYWVDRTEITNAQYALCVAAGKCQPPWTTTSKTRTSYYGDAQFDDFPVTYLGQDQATAYCSWAGRRLPTEAEWEKAARGTDGRLYPWGNQDPTCQLVNYNRCVGDTSPVGSYPTGDSPYGVVDMAGNVWEWVHDIYSGAYYLSQPASNPLGPATSESSTPYRVLRGGFWSFGSKYVRAAFRTRGMHLYDINDGYYGFRCAR